MESNSNQPEIKIENKGKFLKWLENYWYHYKWHTIIVSFFVIVIGVCAVQSITTTRYDIIITYAGPNTYTSEYSKQINEVISSILPADEKGNKNKKATMNMFHIYSAEQIEQITSETDATGTKGYVDTVRNGEQINLYNSYMGTGESSICFLDPELYNKFPNTHKVPLSDIFGENIPDGAVDAYGVRLGDTALYKSSKIIATFPEDTVVCLKQPLVVGNSSNEKKYEYEKQVFEALLTYTAND